MDYPRLVFISPGLNKCNGGTYDHELVNDAKEHKAAIDAGYCDSIPEALESMTVAKEAIEGDDKPIVKRGRKPKEAHND